MIEASLQKSIVWQSVVWHFFEVPKGIIKAWRNFLVFTFNYFSIGLLLRTFFSHWRKYGESYGRGFDPKKYAQVFMGNMISRVLGAIIRLVTIVIGLIAELFVFLAGLIVLFIWLFLPLLLIFGFTFSAFLLL